MSLKQTDEDKTVFLNCDLMLCVMFLSHIVLNSCIYITQTD